MKHLSLLITSLLFTLILSSALKAQPARFDWALQNGSPDVSDTRSRLLMLDDGFIQTGEYHDTAAFEQNSIISAGCTDIYLVKYNDQNQVEWLISEGGTNCEYVEDIAGDENGNIYITGYYYGEMSIGGEVITNEGSQDIFLAKYDSLGIFQWVRHFGGMMADHSRAVEMFGDHPVVAGYFYNSMTIDGTVVNSAGSSDIILVEYTESGDVAGIIHEGGMEMEQVNSVAVSADMKFYIAGAYFNEAHIGDTLLQTSGSSGVYYAAWEEGWEFSTAGQLEGSGLGQLPVLACNGSGILIAGDFSGEITFGSQVFNSGEANTDVFLVSYNQAGDAEWAMQGHSDADDLATDMETDPDGSIFLAGHFLLDYTMGDVNLVYSLCCGSKEVFVIKVSPDGLAEWGKQISGERANVLDLAVNDKGDLVTTGFFQGEVLFDDLLLNSGVTYRNFTDCIRYETAVGIKYPEIAGDEINVFPNPTGGRCNVTLPVEEALIRMYDMTGQCVGEWNYSSPGLQIDLHGLDAGSYILSFPELGKQTLLVVTR